MLQLATDSPDAKPLLRESSTSESTNVEVVMRDLADGLVVIPDYQRDADQWDDMTKSLLIESVINNLTIPAFFFDVVLDEKSHVERNAVIDGQQRLGALFDFFANRLRLVAATEAPYLSPNSVHYAGKTFDELPEPYQLAFKKYRLTVIKLRDLGRMRLEVFRRINHGGTPLSGQDIRLAYYGEGSPSVAFVRMVGIYDPERPAAQRTLDAARARYGLDHPWHPETLALWRDYWQDKDIARGQTASEMFLWAVMAAKVDALDALLSDEKALEKLHCRFNRGIDEALDVTCAQLQHQDREKSEPDILPDLTNLKNRFFPEFEAWFAKLVGEHGISVSKHRLVATIIGAAFALGRSPGPLGPGQWNDIVEFVRHPQERAIRAGVQWPISKGRWDSESGTRTQLQRTRELLRRML